MIKNYFKISIRNILKHKTYSMINVLGLATGMACCMMILLFVKDELSYDQFHKNGDRIYRILSDFHSQGETQRTSVTSPPIGPALKTDFPEVEQTIRISQSYSKVLVKHGEKVFYEDDFYYADPTLLKVFSFPLSEGDAEHALSDPNSVILSHATAEKYFGDSDPLGKTLTIEIRRNLTDYKVSGVLKDIPGNSTFRPNFVIPFSQLGTSALETWWHFGFFTYVLLSESSTTHELESKFPSFMKRHMPPEPNESLPDLVLQPLHEVHLQSDFDNNAGSLGQLTYVYLFSALALFIILIACFNFMNLATARSQSRAREVGVRKAAGAARIQLISQFLCEALIMSLLSLTVAVVLVELFIPVFNEISGKTIYLNLMDNREAAAGFIGIALTVGLVSGSYPAFFLSKFKPVDVLKGTMAPGAGGTLLRKMLVVMQFAISVGLIFGTLVVFSQLEFVKNKKLGFDKEHVVVVPLDNKALRNSAETFKTQALFDPNIVQASLASAFPYLDSWWRTRMKPEGNTSEEGKAAFTFQIDFDYVRTLGLHIIEGRDFSKDFITDSNAFIINEAAVQEFGWGSAEMAVGKTLTWLGRGPEHPKTGRVIGVVEDFHYRSLHEKIAPAVFHIMSDPYDFLFLRVRPNQTADVLSALKKIWTAIDPNHPFEYSFLDDRVNETYKSDEKLGTIFGIFSSLAILIACLGLYGLAAFTTEKRTKEVGIRKVLGAPVAGIVTLLSAEFVKLVLISNLIAWPLAYWAMHSWLENFAYRVDMGIASFILPAAIALAIAVLTVGYQAIKAATANPVEALKYE